MITERGFNLFPPFPDLSSARMLLQSQSLLYNRHEVPRAFREPYIVTGYRSPCSTLSECLISMLHRTNETINFWTHFIATVFFIALSVSLWQQHGLHTETYGYPFVVCLMSACLYPAMSAVAHVFNTMSEIARHFCFFMDYAALSCYSLGVAVAYKAYFFPRELIGTQFYDWFLPIATMNAIICMLFSCQSRFMEQGPLRKLCRITAFAVPYLFDAIPGVYRMLWSVDSDDPSMFYHRRQCCLTFISALLYTTHIPERYFPGKFDIIGHSHQIFHVLTALATRDQLRGMSLDYDERRSLLESTTNHSPPTFASSIVLLSGLLLVDLAIMAFYTVRLYQKPTDNQLKRKSSNDQNGRHQLDTANNNAMEPSKTDKNVTLDKKYSKGNATSRLQYPYTSNLNQNTMRRKSYRKTQVLL